jgi:glycerol-3-phosphate dehydrogenase
VRGSHIVLPMPNPPLSDAFTLQNRDGRVVFVLPWMERFLVIGTTDVPQDGRPEEAACTPEETRYLLDCVEAFLDLGYTATDVIWTWSGVRALVDDGSADPSRTTRDYKLHAERNGRGGLVTVYGGKITTHRRLAEQVLATLEAMGAQAGPPWTDEAPLHGGALSRDRLAALADEGPAALPREVKRRWAFTYGSCARDLMDAFARDPSLGEEIAPGVPHAELLHAANVENARCAADFLERRTKLHLLLDTPAQERIGAWFAGRPAGTAPQSMSDAQWRKTASTC